jgi:hypothetical protein
MLVTGNIKNQHGKNLDNVNVFMSDANGVLIPSAPVVFTDEKGNYAIETLLYEYLTVNHTGYEIITIPITFASNYNLVLKTLSVGDAENDVEIQIDKIKDKLKSNKTYLYIGIGIVILLLGFLIYKIVK